MKGFTLIELLVVVLIIGILSAVALPQYTKAVEKSRMAQAFSLFQPLRQAVDAYVLAAGYSRVELVGHPSGVASAELDVDVEKLANCQSGEDRCHGKDFSYDVWCAGSSCYISICRENRMNKLIAYLMKRSNLLRHGVKVAHLRRMKDMPFANRWSRKAGSWRMKGNFSLYWNRLR